MPEGLGCLIGVCLLFGYFIGRSIFSTNNSTRVSPR